MLNFRKAHKQPERVSMFSILEYSSLVPSLLFSYIFGQIVKISNHTIYRGEIKTVEIIENKIIITLGWNLKKELGSNIWMKDNHLEYVININQLYIFEEIITEMDDDLFFMPAMGSDRFFLYKQSSNKLITPTEELISTTNVNRNFLKKLLNPFRIPQQKRLQRKRWVN